jgi:hypothetical protein
MPAALALAEEITTCCYSQLTYRRLMARDLFVMEGA